MRSQNQHRIRIAVDAMGSDECPKSEIAGASKAKLVLGDKVDLIMVGDKSMIKEIEYSRDNVAQLTVLETQEVVTMYDDPIEVLKSKKESSLYKCIEMVKEGKADAAVSAGNTGAILAVSTKLLGRLEGVSRPTIASVFPAVTGKPTLVLDVGANVSPKASYMYEFAIMGSLYFKQMTGNSNPRVATLNIGEEETKGTELIREVYTMLKESPVNFIGNIEGRDIFSGKADVIVTDGFTGNVVLKLAESFLGVFKTKIKQFSEESFFNKIKTALTVPVIKDMLKSFDYEEYGGIPLLGVNGVVIVGHGKSSEKAVKNMILRSYELTKSDLLSSIEDSFKVKTK